MDTNSRADSIRVMCPLFHAGEGGSTPTSALQLRFGEMDMHEAVALNRLWHSRLPRLDKRLGNCTCCAATYGGLFYAVAIWTNPVARTLPQDVWLELRRFAIAPDAPKNTASRMLGWMARDLTRRLPHVERLISYQDCDTHAGTIYKASGWVPLPLRDSVGSWKSTLRPNRKGERIRRKIRWEKVIRSSVVPGP